MWWILLIGVLVAAAIWAFVISRVDAERADALANETVKNSNLAASHEERVSRSLQVFDLILLGLRDDYAIQGTIRDLNARLAARRVDRGYVGVVSLLGARGEVIATTADGRAPGSGGLPVASAGRAVARVGVTPPAWDKAL